MVDSMDSVIQSVSESRTPRKNKGYIEKNPRIFYQELFSFHDGRNTPCSSYPKISGKEIDLHDLYKLVCSKGGWLKVNARDQWDEVLAAFKVPNGPNSALVLKQIYVRYLDQFEKVNFLGEAADRNEDEEDENRHKKWTVRALHRKTVPMTYNYTQHVVPDQLRVAHKLSTDFYRPTEYDKLLMSLMSPLPNEQDFAINVCTLMSNEERHTIKIAKCPRLVHVLLAHAGIFHHYTMREMFVEFYSKIRKHSLDAFWKDCLIDKPQLLDLSCDGFFNAVSPNNRDDDEVLSLRYANRQKGADFSDDSGLDNDFDAELLGLGRGLGTHDYIGQRVLQVASILRNLSFADDNLLVLSKNRTFLRFLVMCANVHWNNLAMMALDMVGNIANELHLYDPATDELTRHLMTTIADGLESYDRGVIISCLEILSKLSQRESNEEHLYKYLEQKLYDQLARFLCLNDIMLLIYTLECIYALTSLGSKPCSALMHVAGIVDTLVALVTVEAQSYGPNACILMRVVETNYLNTNPYGSMGVASPQAATVTQLTVHNEPISSIPATITMSAEPPKIPSNVTPIPPIPLSVQTVHQTPTTLNLTTMMSPMAPPKTTEVPPAASSPKPAAKKDKPAASKAREDPIATSLMQQSTVATKHAQQQLVQENEQFASLWLRSALEPAANMSVKIEQQEVYKLYITASSKIGRRGVCSPMHFPRIVRTVFGGSVGPTAQKCIKNGAEMTEYYYEGLQPRARPLTVVQKEPDTKIQPTQVQIGDPAITSRLCASPQPTVTTSTGSILVTQVHGKNVMIHQNAAQAQQQQQQQQQPQQQLADSNKSVIVVTSQAGQQPQQSIIVQPSGIVSQTQQQQTTSLIKSLLANKVTTTNDGSSNPSVITSTSAATNVSNCLIASNVNQLHQVAQRQNLQKQKQMAAEQTATTIGTIGNTSVVVTTNPQSSLSNIKLGNSTLTIKPNPNSMLCVAEKQNDPPPLAPLSTSTTVGSTIIKPLLQKQLDDVNKTTVQVIGNTTIVKTNMGDKLVPSGLQSKIMANKMLADLLDKKSLEPPAFSVGPDGQQTSGKRQIDQTTDAGEVDQSAKKVDLGQDGAGDVKPSPKLADLYAKLAGSILEDEDMEEEIKPVVIQQQTAPAVSVITQQQIKPPGQMQQPKMVNMPMQRQIIVTPSNSSGQQMMMPSSIVTGQSPNQQTIYLQHAAPKAAQTQIVHQQPATIMAAPQQQPTQYILATNQQGQTYVVAQHNPQTVLLAQSPHGNQHGATKTIIILQQQPNQPTNSGGQLNMQNQPQKVLMTTNQQGQQVFVTQMPTNQPIRHQMILNPNGTVTQQPIVTSAPSQVSQQIIVQQSAPQPQQIIVQQQAPQVTQTIEKKQIILTASGHIEAAPGTSIQQIQQQQQQQQQQNQFVIQTNQQQQVKIIQQKVGGQTITVQPAAQQPQPPTVIQKSVVVQPVAQQEPATVAPVITTTTVPVTPTAATPAPVQQRVESIVVQRQSQPTPPPPPTVTTQTTTASVQIPATPTSVAQSIQMIPAMDPNKVSEEEVDINWLWVCNWRGCPRKKFKSANEVYLHACAVHCPSNIDPGADIYCQWGNGPGLCDNLPRKRFSLMTHILDRHCTTESFKAAVQRRLQNVGTNQPSQPYPVTLIRQPVADAEDGGGVGCQAPAVNGPGNLASAGSAALHAIKRHAIDFANARELQNTINDSKSNSTNTGVGSSNNSTTTMTSITTTTSTNPQSSTFATPTSFSTASSSLSNLKTISGVSSGGGGGACISIVGDDNEGPVTKSIRLTSALILRNLVNYSTLAARNLRHYEAHLAGVALSNVESSRTIAQVLYDMNETVNNSSTPIN